MKLSVNIEYRTRWGEGMVMCIGNRRIALNYTAGGIWQGEVLLRTGRQREMTYRYEIVRDGRCLRTEWRPHTLHLPADARTTHLHLHDRWLETPPDTVLYTRAFTQCIFGRNAADSPCRNGSHTSDKQAPTSAKRRMHHSPMLHGRITFCITVPSLRPDETLALAAGSHELGGWQTIHPMDDSRFPQWELSLQATQRFEYKFLIADRATLTPVIWEEGPNRTYERLPAPHETFCEQAAYPLFPERRWRGAGTAVPLFSLRTEEDFGIGEFRDLKLLGDWARATGQRVIQLLPINDTTLQGSWADSYPYNSNSTFALHPQYLHLPDVGVAEDEEYISLRQQLNALPSVDYEAVNHHKMRLLRRAVKQTGHRIRSRRDYRNFVASNREWLLPYAAFCTLREHYRTPDPSRWGNYARFHKAVIGDLLREEPQEMEFHCMIQYHLHRQLTDACNYLHRLGIVLKGDLPIGVSRTSADAWVHPQLFHLDSQAGAPPDAFSVYGQNWGFPTYNWEQMARDGYGWWRCRLNKMSEYFDAFRIDHILGFFRIWEIPTHAVRGLLGHFSPALPYSREELAEQGFDLREGRYVIPTADEELCRRLFGELAPEVSRRWLKEGHPVTACNTQRKVAACFEGDDPLGQRLREGFMKLLEEVLFVEDPRRKGYFHPRIAAQSTYCYQQLESPLREAFDRLYNDFFYHRHNTFWKQSALDKLPALLASSSMLACGEDLGMIPDCVPETMQRLQILSLEVQRMPKSPDQHFALPSQAPYLSVCTTSTHDMSTLRGWWEEERERIAMFCREVLGIEDTPPSNCTGSISRSIIGMHLHSPAMLVILPLQDWLSTDERLRRANPDDERINIPANPHHYWRYRMHLTLEELIRNDTFNRSLLGMIRQSGRQ